MHASRRLQPSANAPLSRREHEIIRLIADGPTSKRIAQALSLSPNTIESHRASIMRKTGTSSVAGVVRYAVRSGLIEA